MNEKRIEDLMYQAGITAQGCWDKMDPYDQNAILNFAELVRADAIADEREECAKVCDATWDTDDHSYEYSEACNDCAAAIRSRGTTK